MVDAERMRQHPIARFTGPIHAYDLTNELAGLRAESPIANGGHRQITMLQRGMVTQVLFAFDAGAELREHAVHGVVTIQCLEGRLIALANDHDYELRAGGMLVLDTDIPHDVRALTDSAMLLTVLLYL
jgi:quercetin dioxygenase-like cupin family protein